MTTLTMLLPFCRSCYMVFPSLQLALALSCVMGLVMFARYCGEDHSDKLGTSSRDAVSVYFIVMFPLFFFIDLNYLLHVYRKHEYDFFFPASIVSLIPRD